MGKLLLASRKSNIFPSIILFPEEKYEEKNILREDNYLDMYSVELLNIYLGTGITIATKSNSLGKS
jgi:hypothetical protein